MCTSHSYRRHSPCTHGPTSHIHNRVKQNTIPPSRCTRRTRARAALHARPPISWRRPPRAGRTRARAARLLCPGAVRDCRECRPRLGRSERPPLAAAGRAALRQNLRHAEEASCTQEPAHPCAERARVPGQFSFHAGRCEHQKGRGQASARRRRRRGGMRAP